MSSTKSDVMPIKAIRTLLKVAIAQGYDVDPLLQESGLDFNPLEAEQSNLLKDNSLKEHTVKDNTVKDSPNQVETLTYSKLYKRIMQLLQDESFGFGSAQKSPPGTFRMMCLFIIHCTNLKQALIRSAEFFDYIDQFKDHNREKRIPIVLEQENTIAVCRFDGLPPIADHQSESIDINIIYMMHRLYSWLIDKHIELTEVCLRGREPRATSSYQALFDCPISFNANVSTLKFKFEWLDEPIRQNEDTLKTFLKHAPYQLISTKTNTGTSLADRVHALLMKELNGEAINIEGVAQKLNMSSRTLHRKLQKEGHSFQQLKDNARKEAAINYLGRSELTVNAIALLMGFQDTSAFYRAFKKWTGKAPSFYRH